MSLIKSPMKDRVGVDSVPHRGSGPGRYDYSGEVPNVPGRDGGLIPELARDEHFGKPSHSGPIKDSPFKDAVK